MPTPDNLRDPFDLIGITIEGKYRVASVIGDGGFGVVYRGVHTGFGELIAIKCLKIPTNLDEKHRQDLLEQLKEEGRLLHKLSKATPGIVQALDVGAMTTDAGVWVPFLVLEWLDGETLAEFQKRRETDGSGGMSITEAVELLTPAARALAVAHQHKIAHRDVKPANLFVTKVSDKRTVKVLDFGIAKVLTDTTMTEALAVTRAGPSAFTPRYGAPEQFNKQRGASGPWTDVFALGLILVELTTGRRALDGDDPTQLYVAAADPTLRPTFRGRGLDVADPIESVIARALHVEPKYRYPDAGEFWDALTQAVGLAPDAARISTPAISSAKGKPPSSDNLTTSEFAAQTSLAELTAAPHSGPPEPNAQTKPIESLKDRDNPPAVVVSSKDPAKHPAPPASATSVSAQIAAEAREPGAPSPFRGRASGDDPMAETPPIARVPGVVAAAAAAAAKSPRAAEKRPDLKTTTPSAIDAPLSAPASSQQPERSGRGLLWALLAIAATAGLTAYLYFQRDGVPSLAGPRGSATPTASSRATAPTKATTSASAATSATTSASAAASDAPDAAAPPPAPPEDMVYLAPFTARLGEGATAREVTLTRGVYLDKHEVSSRAYHACVEAGACTAAAEVKSHFRFADPGGAGETPSTPEEIKTQEDVWRARCTEPAGPADHPVNCLTYSQADQYCKSKKRRLPTEAEWEAAAQGADARAYPWGNARADCERACIDKNSECRGGNTSTCATGSHPGDKTPGDVLDLGGNVAEWVADGYLAKPLGGTDPRAGLLGTKSRVVRGGSFFDSLDLLRSSTRRAVPAGAAEAWIGVRCAMDVPVSP